jgi:hypothetical protein
MQDIADLEVYLALRAERRIRTSLITLRDFSDSAKKPARCGRGRRCWL